MNLVVGIAFITVLGSCVLFAVLPENPIKITLRPNQAVEESLFDGRWENES